jgi:hypothetical protein
VPKERHPDLTYFNVPDTGNLLAFNSFEATGTHYRRSVVPSVVTAFKSPAAVDLEVQVQQCAVLAIGDCHVGHPCEDGPLDVLGIHPPTDVGCDLRTMEKPLRDLHLDLEGPQGAIPDLSQSHPVKRAREFSRYGVDSPR